MKYFHSFFSGPPFINNNATRQKPRERDRPAAGWKRNRQESKSFLPFFDQHKSGLIWSSFSWSLRFPSRWTNFIDTMTIIMGTFCRFLKYYRNARGSASFVVSVFPLSSPRVFEVSERISDLPLTLGRNAPLKAIWAGHCIRPDYVFFKPHFSHFKPKTAIPNDDDAK